MCVVDMVLDNTIDCIVLVLVDYLDNIVILYSCVICINCIIVLYTVIKILLTSNIGG